MTAASDIRPWKASSGNVFGPGWNSPAKRMETLCSIPIAIQDSAICISIAYVPFPILSGGIFISHTFKGVTVHLSSGNNSILAYALTKENDSRMRQPAVSAPGRCIRSEPVTVKPDDRQRLQCQAGACQDALDAIHFTSTNRSS